MRHVSPPPVTSAGSTAVSWRWCFPFGQPYGEVCLACISVVGGSKEVDLATSDEDMNRIQRTARSRTSLRTDVSVRRCGRVSAWPFEPSSPSYTGPSYTSFRLENAKSSTSKQQVACRQPPLGVAVIGATSETFFRTCICRHQVLRVLSLIAFATLPHSYDQ